MYQVTWKDEYAVEMFDRKLYEESGVIILERGDELFQIDLGDTVQHGEVLEEGHHICGICLEDVTDGNDEHDFWKCQKCLDEEAHAPFALEQEHLAKAISGCF